MKYRDIVKRKGEKDCYGSSTSGKSDQARVVKEADKDSCDVLTVESGKDKYSDAWLLDAHTTCAQKESGSVLTSLIMETLS